MIAEKYDVVVIGGGPAGLRAAEFVSAAGRRAAVVDQKPSVGRKFLVAGRGGLNLTHSEPLENFPSRYGDAAGGRWESLLRDFSPDDLRAWAKELGIETFVGTSGRVFPVKKQAAPLLRRWIERLRDQGVEFHVRFAWSGLSREADGGWKLDFATPQGAAAFSARAVVLALGGASWPETGSDGAWTQRLAALGIDIAPLAAANCGYEAAWTPEFLREVEGLPAKNVEVRARDESVAGELLVTKYGLEGGAIYQLGRVLRGMERPAITVDFKPSFTVEQLAHKLAGVEPEGLLARAEKRWRLGRVAANLLRLRAPFTSAEELAALAKAYPIALLRPRPIAEAISTAGGVRWDELTGDLMFKRLPGVFCAGEMIDWDAPTGGYLLQGCFSTATRAAKGALKFLTE